LNYSNSPIGVNNNLSSTFNDPVKIVQFKFSKNVYNNQNLVGNQLPLVKNYSKICNSCSNKMKKLKDSNISSANKINSSFHTSHQQNIYDDDEDVICSKLKDDLTLLVNHQYFCKYCNLNLTDANDNAPQLDLIIFNHSKEIYFYEFNPLSVNIIFKLTFLKYKASIFRF
jgi:hypothetical protein